MEKCIFLENEGKCEKKTSYGCYCKKHKRNYLINSENEIIVNVFTFKESDYLRDDLKEYYKKNISDKDSLSKLKKKELYEKVSNDINHKRYYNENISKIIKVQSIIRKRQVISSKELQCNNSEDFYSYDLLIKIPKKYFYSYVDDKDIRWGFDIRSLHKLIGLNYPNPYTTEEIPDSVKEEVNQKYNNLVQDKNYVSNIETVERDRKALIKQKTVDLFSLIEQHGYTCNIDWFLKLSLRRLKELYKQLEDLWNYRLGLSNEYKRIICPPLGLAFNTPVIEVLHYNQKEDIQELIIHDVSKFINCETDTDRRMGFFYFIIALGQVSPHCWEAHHQILSVI